MKKESLAHNTEHLDAGTMLSVLHILHYYYPHFIDYYLHFIEKNNNLPKGSHRLSDPKAPPSPPDAAYLAISMKKRGWMIIELDAFPLIALKWPQCPN